MEFGLGFRFGVRVGVRVRDRVQVGKWGEAIVGIGVGVGNMVRIMVTDAAKGGEHGVPGVG